MFKKSLVALAIASVATTALAADFPQDLSKTVSLEGNALSTVIPGQELSIMLGAEYSVGDIVKFTFTGGEIVAGKVPASLTIPATGMSPANKPLFGLTLGLLNATATELTYRVTETTTQNDSQGNPLSDVHSTVGQVIKLPAYTTEAAEGLRVLSNTFTGSVVVDYSAKTSTGDAIDTSGNISEVYLAGKTQFTGKVADEFDAVIDVNNERKQFVADDDTLYIADTMDLSFEDLNASWKNAATLTKQNVVVSGKFAFLDQDTDKDGIQPKADAVKVQYQSGVNVYTDIAKSADVKVTESAVSFELSRDEALAGVRVTVSAEGENSTTVADSAIPTQDFTAKAVASYTVGTATGTSTVINNADAGEWVLNGAVVHVPFMPFRDGYSPIVNVSNTSNQDGDIEVVVYAQNDAEWVEPMTYSLDVTAKAEAQTNITAALKAAGIEGDVAFDIIVNAPRDDIEVNALYFSGGDRAVINTVKQK
jgi:hypothetical protein